MSNNSLMDVIDKRLMVVPSKSDNKEKVINELANLLVSNGNVTDAELFLKDVYLREKEGVTGIGKGIAIPHGKSENVISTSVAVAVVDKEIEWETLDNELVKVVILFAVKNEDANTTHLLMLQEVAKLLAHDDFVSRIVNVSSVDELYDLFIGSK